MKGFTSVAPAALKSKALDRQDRGMNTLGIRAMRCDDCIGFYAKAAVEGATRAR
jgi:alkylhydroperoxidase/carboxymuconolactone decarboxylase family protein YurZ